MSLRPLPEVQAFDSNPGSRSFAQPNFTRQTNLFPTPQESPPVTRPSFDQPLGLSAQFQQPLVISGIMGQGTQYASLQRPGSQNQALVVTIPQPIPK